MSVIDHMPRCLMLVAISNKSAVTIAHVLVERVFSLLSVPETLHSDEGSEFEKGQGVAVRIRVQKGAHVSVPPTRQLRLRACAQYFAQHIGDVRRRYIRQLGRITTVFSARAQHSIQKNAQRNPTFFNARP